MNGCRIVSRQNVPTVLSWFRINIPADTRDKTLLWPCSHVQHHVTRTGSTQCLTKLSHRKQKCYKPRTGKLAYSPATLSSGITVLTGVIILKVSCDCLLLPSNICTKLSLLPGELQCVSLSPTYLHINRIVLSQALSNFSLIKLRVSVQMFMPKYHKAASSHWNIFWKLPKIAQPTSLWSPSRDRKIVTLCRSNKRNIFTELHKDHSDGLHIFQRQKYCNFPDDPYNVTV